MKRLLILMLLMLGAGGADAQVTLSGHVTDSRTGEALNGAQIVVAGTTVGTVAVGGGEFRLRIAPQYAGRNVTCSLLGYRSVTLPIPAASQSGIGIALESLPTEIDRVVVMPEDRLRTLLEAAYNRIPDNYYTRPTQLTGFFRESSRSDAGNYQYFSEAVIEARLNSYENRNEPQIRIVKSVANEFPALDSVRHRWINGVFGVASADFVKRRGGVIDPAHYDEISYKLDPMTSIDGRPVYSISYRPKDNSRPGSSGKLYIDEETLAYLGAEWEANAAALRRNSLMRWRGIPAHSLRGKVQYAPSEDGRMYLRYFINELDLEGDDHTSEYVTTLLVTDSVGSLSYAERIERSDIFLEKAKEYHDDNYWEEYNVFARDSALDAQLRARFDAAETQRLLGDRSAMVERERRVERRRNTLNGFIRFATKLGIRYGFTYLPASGREGLYELSVAGTPVELSERLGGFEFIPTLTVQIDYSITKSWSVNYIASESVGKKLMYGSHGLGATYGFLLNRWGRPWIAEAGLGWSWSGTARNFSEWTRPADGGTMNLLGKRFDAKKVRFGVGYATTGLTPRIGIRHRISTLWWIHAGVGFYQPVWTRQRVFAAEKSGFFLFRRSARENTGSSGITLRYNGAPTTTSHIAPFRWLATVGIMLKY